VNTISATWDAVSRACSCSSSLAGVPSYEDQRRLGLEASSRLAGEQENLVARKVTIAG
jgi:hypothetical protein